MAGPDRPPPYFPIAARTASPRPAGLSATTIPADFIASARTHSRLKRQHDIMMSNFFAQSEALMRGRTLEETVEGVGVRGGEGRHLVQGGPALRDGLAGGRGQHNIVLAGGGLNPIEHVVIFKVDGN